MTTETTAAATETTDILTALVQGRDVSEARLGRLREALALGATESVLMTLRDATRLSRSTEIVLPAHRYEGLSRGRGWCRQGRGDSAVWGERVGDGYRVGPGRWTVGATDGFRRKDSTDWVVRHITVGAQTWTIAD